MWIYPQIIILICTLEFFPLGFPSFVSFTLWSSSAGPRAHMVSRAKLSRSSCLYVLFPETGLWWFPCCGSFMLCWFSFPISHFTVTPLPPHRRKKQLSTHLQSSILLLQHVIACESPNKGTSDLEIRSVTISMTNIWALRKWTLKSEFTFHPTGPGSLIHQDTRYVKWHEEVSLPGHHHLQGHHCLGTKISNLKLRKVQKETQDTS